MDKKIFDVAIIGAGAAGMTAGIYALRAKKSVLIIERAITGGQIVTTNKIENYPGLPGVTGPEFAKALKEQVLKFSGEFLDEEVISVKKTKEGFKTETTGGEIYSRTVILANGSTEKKLGLEREKELVGHGISYCATCDGAFFREKDVAVFGGGNSALYSALYLSGIARKVYLIHRRDEFRAEEQLVEKAREKENIEFVMNSVVSDLIGEEKLEKIIIENVKNREKTELKISGLFVMIGRTADNEKFRGLVELDENGYIKSDENCATTEPGVFCAGDTRAKKLYQLVTATADGAIAATGAIEFLEK